MLLDTVHNIAFVMSPTHIIVIMGIKLSPQSFYLFFVCQMQNALCLPNFIHKYKTYYYIISKKSDI